MGTTQSDRETPTRDELLGYFDDLSNWGRWGDEDERGTLNLITPSVRLSAAKLITEGVVVPLGMDLDADNPDPLGRGTEMGRKTDIHHPGPRVQGVREEIQMSPHGSPTHIDAPSHFAWDGKMYNGFPASAVTPTGGASKLSVHNAREGIVTRGVLLDVAAARGVDWLQPGEGAYPEDLDAAEERQGVKVREGDFLIIRTGYLERVVVEGAEDERANGYHAACLPWLHERGVAVVASDALNDIQPSGYGPDKVLNPAVDDLAGFDTSLLDLLYPVHAVALVAMGAWLVDNVVVDELKATCERLGRWEFFLSTEPLRLVGASGSQVNPLAVF